MAGKRSKIDPIGAENRKAAQRAGLSYVLPDSAGIKRVNSGGGFKYVSSSGAAVREAATLDRIRALVIPPAWKDVWICRAATGHIQVLGVDARGRKQYRYHARWRAARDRSKYDHVIDFAEALPAIRRTTAAHLRLPGLPRRKVLAAVIRVLEQTLIRVGNQEYAASNGSYGLTTMQDKHAKISGKKLTFDFKGKSGVKHAIDVTDPKLIDIVRKCRDLPGSELFQYRDESGAVHDINSTDVNDYLREISGGEFTAKDFRTWAGTVLAARALSEFKKFDSTAEANRNLVKAIEAVAMKLGNTRAVCRKCYIHPLIMDSYLDGSLARRLSKQAGQMLAKRLNRLPSAEAAVLTLLRGNLRHSRTAARKVA